MTLPRARSASLPDLGSRYRAQRALGEGGFGVVYEALDQSTGQKVAIKALTRARPGTLAQFKREFRALADVNHPHLVGLRELYEHEGTWLIVMELIEGTDLLSWVRGSLEAHGPGFDEARLRKAFAGVVQGLAALHGHGLLYRDLKPSNVRVGPDGRAVLLDFGLVTLADPGEEGAQRGAPGTIAYMAPEQAAEHKLTPAADFYALGVSLYEALTGQLPFPESSPIALLMRKMREDPPAALSLNPRVPQDLNWLCSALLEREPGRRPLAQTTLQTLLGSEARAPSVPSLPLMADQAAPPSFEGRSRELEVLAQALGRTRKGELRLVIIEGESGIGKTALLSHFARRQRELAPQTWVLSGRCYEHERVPYKALDGCMDGLASALDQLPPKVCATLLPRFAGLVGELFPALGSIKPFLDARLSGAPAEPAARRQEAFRALAELLTKLAEVRPLIFVIDDLQWADVESFHLLAALLERREAPPILIACTVRPEHELSDELRAALGELRKASQTEWLGLRGLETMYSENLARALLGGGAEHSLVDRLAQESRGHPLLLAELARYARSHGSTTVKLTLDAALGARIEALGPVARALLDALAVSAAPRSEVFFADLCGFAGFTDALKHLLAERLVRRNSALELMPAHDRIRAAVVARIGAQHLRNVHRALAQQLEKDPGGHAAELALHWDQAAEAEKACIAYRQAADAAMNALAFAGAEVQYARALELLGESASEDRLALLTRRGRAAAALGKSVEAAERFEEAALLAVGAERVQLRVLAAQHQIQSAQFAAGMANTRAVLAELDVPLPDSQVGAIARIVWERVRIGLRGTNVQPRGDVPKSERMLLDAVTGLIFPLSWADFALGNALNMQHLRRALTLGEPGHAARALAQEAILQVMQGRNQECERLMRRAEALASSTSDPVSRSFVALSQASVASLLGDVRVALSQTSAAEELLASSCPGETWLLTNARAILASALASAGDDRQLIERHTVWLTEAEQRRDLFAIAAHMGLGMGSTLPLMRDRPAEALDALRQALEPWSDRPVSFAHYGEMIARMAIASYRGTADGWTWHEQQRPKFDKALFYQAGPPRHVLHFSRATAALAALPHSSAAERPKRLAAAAALTRRMPLFGWGCTFHELLKAQLCALRNEPEAALVHARRAHDAAAERGQTHWALNASYLCGVLEGGQGGQARCRVALTHYRERDWQDPWRAATMYVPVARALEGRANEQR